MAVYLCKVICTHCGEVYEDLIDRTFINDGIEKETGSMESINYRCDYAHKFVRIRRFFRGINETHFHDDKVDICPACKRKVMSFGDRFHREIGTIDALLKEPCAKCHTTGELILLEREEYK